MIRSAIIITAALVVISAAVNSIHSKLDALQKQITETRKEYKVDTDFVIVNPCDLFDAKMKTKIAKNLR